MEHTWFIIFLSIPSRYPRQTTGDGEVLTGAVCSGNHNIHSQTPPPPRAFVSGYEDQTEREGDEERERIREGDDGGCNRRRC
ncbi:hypothetical protein HanXRQr2_Chr13g0572641 [Helianthus annuus]|uniref:Uncharacterized protein n=1 Tax=Helianthus annuus TaxID=4232 RepID=A0A9K3EFK3_HELAN|nr:hypothetical protein HanXRQr2_Chr13g0572641 [Helianthus annuus]KAJ0496557.1 hypothetical protein HanHA89_Chr13g0501141 [Helianthus annuus]